MPSSRQPPCSTWATGSLFSTMVKVCSPSPHSLCGCAAAQEEGNGVRSVTRPRLASAYGAMFLGASLPLSAKEIWKTAAPLRLRFFFWLVLHGRCWTAERRRRHGLQRPTILASCVTKGLRPSTTFCCLAVIARRCGTAGCRASNLVVLPLSRMILPFHGGCA